MTSSKHSRYIAALCAFTALVTVCRVLTTSEPTRADGAAVSECTCADRMAIRGHHSTNRAQTAAAADGPVDSPVAQPSATTDGVADTTTTSQALAGQPPPTTTGAAIADSDYDGDDEFIIPNVFHFIRFDQTTVTFVEMLSIKSVLRLNPRLVMIHCNLKPEGKFWNEVSDDRRLVLVHRDPPEDIHGIKPYWIQHKSDLVRIQVLREYGGIYLDNDCIMLRSVDYLRKGHKCVVAKSSRERYLGSMFAMAAVGCRYLTMFENLYKIQYNASLWYYNAGELPTTELLEKHPGIAHVVDQGIEMDIIGRLFIDNEPVEAFSKSYDVLHTFYNHRYVVQDATDYDTVDYKQYNTSFANIARWLIGS